MYGLNKCAAMRISINSSKKKQDSTIKAFRFACLEGREGGREGGRGTAGMKGK